MKLKNILFFTSIFLSNCIVHTMDDEPFMCKVPRQDRRQVSTIQIPSVTQAELDAKQFVKEQESKKKALIHNSIRDKIARHGCQHDKGVKELIKTVVSLKKQDPNFIKFNFFDHLKELQPIDSYNCFPGRTASITSVAISSDGNFLLASAKNKKPWGQTSIVNDVMMPWSEANVAYTVVLNAHNKKQFLLDACTAQADIFSSAIDKNGTVAVTGDRKGGIRIFDIQSNRKLPIQLPQSEDVFVAISADGKRIAAATTPHDIRIFDSQELMAQNFHYYGQSLTKWTITVIGEPKSILKGLALSHDGTTCVVASDKKFTIWRSDDRWSSEAPVSIHNLSTDGTTFSGSLACDITDTQYKKNQILTWNMETGKLVSALTPCKEKFTDKPHAITPDSKNAVVAQKDGVVELWTEGASQFENEYLKNTNRESQLHKLNYGKMATQKLRDWRYPIFTASAFIGATSLFIKYALPKLNSGR